MVVYLVHQDGRISVAHEHEHRVHTTHRHATPAAGADVRVSSTCPLIYRYTTLLFTRGGSPTGEEGGGVYPTIVVSTPTRQGHRSLLERDDLRPLHCCIVYIRFIGLVPDVVNS